ncbi:calcium/sodium antiporter [Sodaliphilus pleomorphus]|uniref:Calcium/sodium antiporter n=1 Tax=Sodaliphilus pleomorphus TaxID=2606626 RepID=A0A6L5XDU0_9BACT|nr:calcium/sodium antiporter [Sodaliphilus pleomorphus]MSS17478.1 calcium/sodium antiporter [Sodaliphilus pleomorphus]
MDYLFLLIGLGLLLAGAEFLVDSSVAIAKRARISNFIIGLTIVGMGTSAPELFVSISSAIAGHGDIALGNVVGSNICNILLILGLTAAIFPFNIERENQKRDIPFCIFASVLLMLCVNDKWMGIPQNTLSRLDGIVFLLFFVGYMAYVVVNKGKNPAQALQQADDEAKSRLEGKAPLLLWLVAAASLAALLFGGNIFLDASRNLARAWGMSEAVISITIVAVGTSLPELITSVVAAAKHNTQLALGNIIGSCVFNILMILGVAATIKPLSITGINIVDFAVLVLSAVMIYLVTYTFGKKRFDRIEGVIFLLVYVGYTVYLLQR